MQPKQILSSKLAAALLIILLAFLVNIKYRQWKEERSVNKLKNDLQQQAAAQQKKNQDLSDSLSYLNSNDFKEQVARQQLDLKKNGEVVYNFTEDGAATVPSAVQPPALANPQKWWRYFFGQ